MIGGPLISLDNDPTVALPAQGVDAVKDATRRFFAVFSTHRGDRSMVSPPGASPAPRHGLDPPRADAAATMGSPHISKMRQTLSPLGHAGRAD